MTTTAARALAETLVLAIHGASIDGEPVTVHEVLDGPAVEINATVGERRLRIRIATDDGHAFARRQLLELGLVG